MVSAINVGPSHIDRSTRSKASRMMTRRCCKYILLLESAEGEQTNALRAGGVQVPGKAYIQPSYKRTPVPHGLFHEHLMKWSKVLTASTVGAARRPVDYRSIANNSKNLPGGYGQETAILAHMQSPPIGAPTLTVDILIPSYRADPKRLSTLFAAVSAPCMADVKLLVQIDNPKLDQKTDTWLQMQQQKMLHRLKVRRNDVNLGAGLTRNVLLDNSHADYVIMFDDDVVPGSTTLQAYIAAFKANPGAAGFAGALFHVEGI